MSDRLFKQIQHYYGKQRPSHETVAFLLELAHQKNSITYRSKFRLLAWIASAAAAIIAAGAIGYRIGSLTIASAQPRIAIDSRESSNQKLSDKILATAPSDSQKYGPSSARLTAVTQSGQSDSNKFEISAADREKMRGKPVVATIPPIEGEDLPHPAIPPTPRLLLARIYAEWCPRTPRLIPIYELLSQDYANEPIMIVTFDVTNAGKRRQSGYLAHSLGVLGLLGHKWEPSTILLIDRDSCEILETIREVDDQPRLEEALAVALHR